MRVVISCLTLQSTACTTLHGTAMDGRATWTGGEGSRPASFPSKSLAAQPPNQSP